MIMIIWVYWSIRFHWMFRNSFQCQSIMDSTSISLKRPTSLNIINNKVNGSDKRILIQVKTNLERSYKLHSTSLIWMFDFHKVLRLCIPFLRTCNLVEILVSDRIGFVIDKMSNTNWYQVPSVSHLFLFLSWFGIFIRDVNELLSFIFTTSFSNEYNFLNFHCEDPFIILLNVSWRTKWFSNRFWSSEY